MLGTPIPPAGAANLRVYLATPHTLVRSALSTMLHREPAVCLAGNAATVKQALRELVPLRVNILLLQSELASLDNLRLIAALQNEAVNLGVVVMGDLSEDELVDALSAGVTGHLPRSSSARHLMAVVNAVGAKGELALPRASQQRLVWRLIERQEEQRQALRLLFALTRQEQRVLRLLLKGCSNRLIGTELAISPQTARTHVQNLLTKLGARSRLEAVAWVTRDSALSRLLAETA